MSPHVARSVSPFEILDLNYIGRDAATNEDWEVLASSSSSFATGASLYYPVATGSFAPQVQLSPMANNDVFSTSYYTLVAGSIPSKATPWLATSTPSQAHAAPEMTLSEINGASDIFMDMYKDMPGLSTSPLSSTSTAGLNTPVTDNNAVDDILRNMGLPDWVVSGNYNEFDALGFLADPNKDVGGLPADAPHALEALPGPLSSPAADVADHEPDRHDVNAPHVAAPVLSSVRNASSSSSRSRANYSVGGKTLPGAAGVLAHSGAADDVDDHERVATVKRPRKKRAQRGAAEAAQFAPADDPCANDEALARQLAQELSLPRTTRSSRSSGSSTKRKRNGAEADDALAQDVILDRPLRGKPSRTSKRAVARPNPPVTAASDFDSVMSEDEQSLASTSRTPDPSRPIKALRSHTVKRPAPVPASSYDFDSDMLDDDNHLASTSHLPYSTDDDDDDDYSFEPESDGDDDDFSLGKRKRGSAATSKKSGQVSASGSGVKRSKRTHEPHAHSKEEEEALVAGLAAAIADNQWNPYIWSATDAQKEANFVPNQNCKDCTTGKYDTFNEPTKERHRWETIAHQPPRGGLYGNICKLCGQDFPRGWAVTRHLQTGLGRCRHNITPSELQQLHEAWAAVWTPKIKQTRTRRKKSKK